MKTHKSPTRAYVMRRMPRVLSSQRDEAWIANGGFAAATCTFRLWSIAHRNVFIGFIIGATLPERYLH